MLRLSLNGQWVMRRITNRVSDKEGQNTAECFSDGVSGRIPGSVYSFLLGAELMEDPYYRDRELDALRRMEEEYTFSRVFIVAPSLGILSAAHQCLRFDGIDTLSQVRRIRHHASLGIWCGNNEMEQFALVREFEGDDITAADYLIQNEFIIPEILKKEDPDTFYWPSSPSSGGRFDSPQDPDRGDVHFWDVWHAGKPFTEYRKYHFRYLSEFGFQSFPCMETVRSFTEEEDRNIFSYVMEMHQRNAGANGKIMQYLSATYRYPADFETLLYTSQLLQADAIRYGVEHLRRNRDGDRCMGAVYWQLNDIWPVASWSSIDYYHRWKALQYSAVRFFAPVLLSCEEESMVSRGETCITEPQPGFAGETFAYPVSKARLNVSNETWERVTDEVIWELRAPDSTVLRSGRFTVDTAPFSTQWFEELDFSEYDPRYVHLTYHMDSACGGSVLFVPPKYYRFKDPALEVRFDPERGEVSVTSAAYARYIEIYSEDGYIRTDDNFFDMEAGTRVNRYPRGPLSR